MPQSPLSSRAEAAAKIAANPRAYKICEGCDSIIGASATLCPNCHSYRFESSPQRVIEQATLLGARDQKTVTAEDLGS